MNDQDPQQKKRGTLDRANNLIDKAKTARTLYRGIKAARAAGLLANPLVLTIIAIIVGLAFLVFITIIVTDSLTGAAPGETNFSSIENGGETIIIDQNSVLGYAIEITSRLAEGYDNAYNRLSSSLSSNLYSTGIWPSTSDFNKYWCTYLVIDSYRLTGASGLTKDAHAAVINMLYFWKSSNEYSFIDYNNNRQQALSQIQPGYAIFFLANDPNFNHVAIVNSINWTNKENGYGTLTTKDSNVSLRAGGTTITYAIKKWNIDGILRVPGYRVEGFGSKK